MCNRISVIMQTICLEVISTKNLNLSTCKVLLRNCKVDVMVFEGAFEYNEIITNRRVSL